MLIFFIQPEMIVFKRVWFEDQDLLFHVGQFILWFKLQFENQFSFGLSAILSDIQRFKNCA